MDERSSSTVVDFRSASAGGATAPPPGSKRMVPWVVTQARRRPVVAGAVAGFAWGVVMRAWMRFIAVDPEFSWGGTLFIITASVIVGSLLGLARLRRAAGGVGWWRFNVLALGLLGAGGAVMWPSVMLGALAMGWRRWWAVRVGLLVAAVGAQVPVLQAVIDENWWMTDIEAAVAVASYIPLIAFEAWAFSVVFARAIDGAPRAGAIRRVAFAIPILLMTAGSVLVLGAAG